MTARDRMTLSLEKLLTPLCESLPKIGNLLMGRAVPRERGVGYLCQRTECVREHHWIESAVGVGREFQQPLARELTGAHRSVDIEKVPRKRSTVERTHLVSHRVIDMQHRADTEQNRRVGAPVRRQFDLVFRALAAGSRGGDHQSDEALRAGCDPDRVAVPGEGRDDGINGSGEIRPPLPVGEQVHIPLGRLPMLCARTAYPPAKANPNGPATRRAISVIAL